jgi:hypothetical protein
MFGRQKLKNFIKVSAAIVAVVGVASVATAQSVVPFANEATVNGGNVVTSGSPLTGTIESISGATTNLSSGLPGAFAPGLYSIDFSSLTNYLSVKDATNTIVLEGQTNVLANLYVSVSDPTFILTGTVTYTGGTWLDAIRIATAGSANGQTVTGGFGFTGLPAGRIGVDQVSLSASAVPEPGEWAAMGMLASGLGGLVIRARRRKLA